MIMTVCHYLLFLMLCYCLSGVISRSSRQKTSEEATNYCDRTIILNPLFLALQRSLCCLVTVKDVSQNSLKKATQATAKVESAYI